MTLTAKWRERPATLHGMHAAGFPNCFVFSPLQSGFTVNFPHMLNEQAIHCAHVVRSAVERGATLVEATPEAEDEWVKVIESLSAVNLRFQEACTPGYYNNEGRPEQRHPANTSYGAGPFAFVKVLEEWRAGGDFAGLHFA